MKPVYENKAMYFSRHIWANTSDYSIPQAYRMSV